MINLKLRDLIILISCDGNEATFMEIQGVHNSGVFLRCVLSNNDPRSVPVHGVQCDLL